MPSQIQHQQRDGARLHATFYALAPAPGVEAPVETAARTIDVVASTERMDRCGRVVLQDWDLSTYLLNPVVYWNHAEAAGFFGSGDTNVGVPIGFATNVRVEPYAEVDDDGIVVQRSRLRATLNFVDAKANPLAETIYQGMLQGSIRAVSVGWIAHSVRVEVHDDVEIIICANNELLEISPVAIPANPDAVRSESARFVASLRNQNQGPTMPTKLAASLRLKASATDEEISSAVDDITAACDKLKGLLGPAAAPEEDAATAEAAGATASARVVRKTASAISTLVTLLSVANIGEAVAAVTGLKASAEAGAKATAELAKQREEHTAAEVAALIVQGEKDGQLTPGNKASYLTLCDADPEKGKLADPGKLRALLANLPKVVNQTKTATGDGKGGDGNGSTPAPHPLVATLSQREIARCARMKWDVNDYAAKKAAEMSGLAAGGN